MPGPFPFQPDPNDSYNEEIDQSAEAYEDQTELPLEDEQFPGEEDPVSPESMLPPEARGETNGGPLGCCLGLTVGLMLSLFLGLIGFGHLTALVLAPFLHADAITNIRIATGFFGSIGAIIGGFIGWKIGKRVYREYESPILPERRRRTRPMPKQAKL
ncbi:MAG: hypothetical protein ACR2H5_08695 [Ktedonobacteraceae bacterium]